MREAKHDLSEFSISTDPKKLDFKMIHDYLANESYWSRNIPLKIVKSAAKNSLNFGVYHLQEQIGYARVITDYTTVAYLGDVFILEKYRGLGLSKLLVKFIMTHAKLQGLRRWVLLTSDAHGLYKQFGWKEIANPEKWMEVHIPDIYK